MRACRCSVLLLFVGAFLASGCEHAGPLEPVGLEPTLSSIQANIFTTNCAISGCHAGASSQQGLDLSQGQAHANLVQVRSRERPDLFRVDPGNPDDSYLVKKIMGAVDIVGSRMPLGRAPLSAEQIDAIRGWIAGGAPDN